MAAAPASAATGDGGVSLVVAPKGGGVLQDGKPLDVQVRITNGGTSQLAAGRLALSMTPGPVASIRELLTLPSDLQGLLLTRTSATTPALDPGASAEVDVRIPAQDIDETLGSNRADGARLLDVQLRAPGGVRVLAQSSATRMSGSKDRVGLGTVIPITIPAGSTGLVDAAGQERLTADDGAWTQGLAAAKAMPDAVVALDPAVLASVRLAGDAAPGSAKDFLDALRGLPNTVVRLPYADGDVTLQRAAGLGTPREPESWSALEQVASSDATTAPTPAVTPAPTASTTTSDPTDWDWSSTDVVWPVPGTTDDAALAALSGEGTVLLGSGDVQDSSARAAAGPLSSIGGRRVLVADSTTSGLLADATRDDVDGRSAAAALVGALATDAVSGAAPTVLAVAGRDADPAGLAGVLQLLGDQSWIRGAGLDDLVQQSRVVGTRLRSGAPPSARVSAARTLVAEEEQVEAVGRAAADPASLTAPYRLSLLGLLSAAWRGDDAGWSSALSTTGSAFTAMPKQVRILEGDRALVSTDGVLTVQVQNDLPQPISVDVTATTNNNRLRFTGGGRVQVAAKSTNKTQLRFQSISNGQAVVDLSLATPQGTRFGSTVQKMVTVQAGFDTVVAVILLAGLAVLLALGIYRNVIRRRRPRAER